MYALRFDSKSVVGSVH